jgi:hypothetical protein
METTSSDPRERDPRMAQRIDPTANGRQTGGPTADEAMKNESPGDGIMEDDLTEEREPAPEQREDVAEDEPQDP